MQYNNTFYIKEEKVSGYALPNIDDFLLSSCFLE